MSDITWAEREWTLICPKCHRGYFSKMVQCYRTLGGVTKRKGLSGQFISDTITVTPGSLADEEEPVSVQFPRVHITPEKTVCGACDSGKKKKKELDI